MSDEAKLPKWAQDRLRDLRRRVTELERDNAAILGQADPSKCRDLWFEEMLSDEGGFPAPLEGRRLIFRGSTGRIQITGERSGRNSGQTWLNLNGIDGEGLIVRPWASNSVTIRCAGNGEIG
jgi:hypothetical protein